jgi:ADP-ribose pyrophosphatase YjhB (NUDIX family)
MICFKKNNIKFNYRIAGISIYNKHVLLHRTIKDNFWSLPGGRCELLENSKDCIIREYKEEMNIEITVGRPLFFVEHDFRISKINLTNI